MLKLKPLPSVCTRVLVCLVCIPVHPVNHVADKDNTATAAIKQPVDNATAIFALWL
jgi:hypothetical protein